MRKRAFFVGITLLLGVIFSSVQPVFAQSFSIFTPYTGMSVTPGEDISYDVEVINDTSSVQHTSFEVKNLPKDWEYTLRAGGNNISQLSVLPGEEESVDFDITVPLEVDKGDYNFSLEATTQDGETSVLPFTVTVSEKGTFKTEFHVEQPNMEGHAESKFSYTAELQNFTAEEQHYSLTSKEPEGWTVTFKADSSSVTSVSVEPGATEEIEIEIQPAENAVADTYEIPIVASSGSTTEEATLEAVVTGKYDLQLSTPEGNLSSSLTAGKSKTINLVVENTGTIEVTDIELSSTTPPDWEVEFDHDQIDVLEAGESTTVQAKVTAPGEAIAGDYVTTFEAKAALASADADFRMSVKTSTVWGFVAVSIIVAVIAGLVFVFKKFGRR
ncbi:MAG TPA: NEW3 domain-containing protein [Bacillota bacterium]|nr:NEW3 domain-containing protein [Bacillota bacterium]